MSKKAKNEANDWKERTQCDIAAQFFSLRINIVKLITYTLSSVSLDVRVLCEGDTLVCTRVCV